MREAKDPFSKKGESEDGRQATKTDATIANELINKKDTGTRLDSSNFNICKWLWERTPDSHGRLKEEKVRSAQLFAARKIALCGMRDTKDVLFFQLLYSSKNGLSVKRDSNMKRGHPDGKVYLFLERALFELASVTFSNR